MGPLDIQLSTDELERLGVDAATAVRLPPENGGGFYVNLEFQHQLHCVVSSAHLCGMFHTNILPNEIELSPYGDVYELLRNKERRVYRLQTNSTDTPWYVSCRYYSTAELTQ